MLPSLNAIAGLKLTPAAALSDYTRFGIGGPARLFIDAEDEAAFVQALGIVRAGSIPWVVIGGGTNLVVSDAGFDGIVLRFQPSTIKRAGQVVHAQAGAILQDVVDRSIEHGLSGLQSMTGIPGYLGGAVYGNAGAYGQSIQQVVERVHFTDGTDVRSFTNEQCEFRYRESVFKRNKHWIILSAELRLTDGDPEELARGASEIRSVRDAKYPPTMKCAGSIFKNLLFAQLPLSAQQQVPPKLVRDGKVPSAWFLEQVDVKGMRVGEIRVADYHANLIYNDGNGTAADLVYVIAELKRRVRERFHFEIEEEVQYVGF